MKQINALLNDPDPCSECGESKMDSNLMIQGIPDCCANTGHVLTLITIKIISRGELLFWHQYRLMSLSLSGGECLFC